MNVSSCVSGKDFESGTKGYNSGMISRESSKILIYRVPQVCELEFLTSLTVRPPSV